MKIQTFYISSLILFLLYVFSYIAFSVWGRYEPASIGLNGVKSYAWAPKYFVMDFKWSTPMRLFYIPGYYMDTRFWHTEDKAYTDKYPVNEVPVEEIGRVYQAWEEND